MKNKKKLLALSMSALMFFSSVPQNFSLAYAVTEQKTETVSVKSETKELPSSVDWSTSEYLAPVGDQGASGSCWHYGTIYASMNFFNNKERGEKATNATIINPIFGYNYAMRTTKVQMDLVHAIGYPSVDVLPINTKELKSLFPYKEVWESALLNRGGEMISVNNYGEEDSIITGPKDASLNLMKEVLCSGKVIAVGALSYNWNTSVVASGEHKGEYAIDRCDLNKTGGHIMAIVGYDDDIWIDINYDGKQQEAELGAIKIMNSWGSDWANDGFAWVAYDALNKTSQVLTQEDVNRINAAVDAGKIKCNKVNNQVRKSFFMFDIWSYPTSVRERKTSNCLIYFTVNTGSRREMAMSVTATEKKTGEQASFVLPDLSVEKENLALDGTAASTDGTLVLDLDNVIPDISPDTMENYDWEVTFEDNAKDTYSLTVKDLYFTVDGAKKYLAMVSNLPLNGEKRTYKVHKRTAEGIKDTVIEQENNSNVIIYYNNDKYKDASIHYQVGSGTWTKAPGVQMCADDTQKGYKWKYVINLGNEKKLNVCFNTNNTNWDSNNEKNYTLEAGCYGIKNGVITPLTESEKAKDPLIELEKTNLSLHKGEEGMITASVIDGSLKDIVWTSSNEKIATVSKDGKINAVNIGTATITASIGEVHVNCEVTVKEAPATPVPEKTKTPVLTATPGAIKTPEVTKTPVPSKTPGVTKTPVPTKTPEVTKTPAPTKTPEATKTPVPTKTPEVTKTPVPVKTPEVTKTPVPTNTPEPTKLPVSAQTPTPSKLPEISTTPAITPETTPTGTVIPGSTVSPSALTVNKKSYTLYTKGRTKVTLKALLNGTEVSPATITWSSSNKKIAKVNAKGVVTAKKKGKVNITALYSNGDKATCTITVKKPSIKLKTKSKVKLRVGKTLKVKATSTPGGRFEYKSYNKTIVTVTKKGVIKARKKGTTYIRISRNGIKKKIKIVVK